MPPMHSAFSKFSFSSLKNPENLALMLLLLAACLLLGQHWGMTLSNSDDPAITRFTFAQVLETASSQGRFWLVPIGLLARLPYAMDSWEVANACKIIVNGAAIALFIVFCMRLCGKAVGALMGLVWLALIDVGPGYYSPFHGYLMMFNLQFAALFASFIWYLHLLDRPQAPRLVVGPYLLYAFALLAYEPMLFYAGVFPALTLYRQLSQPNSRLTLDGAKTMAIQFLRSNYVLAVVVLGYVVTYFVYRALQPSMGRGIDHSGQWVDIVKTIYRFSVHGLHMQTQPLGNYVAGITTPLTQAMAIAYGLLLAVAGLLLIPKIQGAAYPAVLYNKTAIGILLFFVFCPNVLHGFVQNYRLYAADDPHYVGNYFSAFPLAMLASLVVMYLVGGQRARQEKVLFAVVLAFIASSACDNYMRWSNVANTNRRDSALWQAAITDLHTTLGASHKTLLLCGKNAPEKVSGNDHYWSMYLSRVLQRPIEYRSKWSDAVQCDTTIEFNRYRYVHK